MELFHPWTEALSGIPQGSFFGPTLSVCFINDLPQTISLAVQIFADDTKIYRAISTPEDNSLLQKDLDSVTKWSQEWQLHFNEDKCKVLHLGRNNEGHSYHMGHTELEATLVEKDLGVHMDHELKFHHHVNTSAKKANKILGLIKHTFHNLDEVSLPLLYKTLVRPHLEYANVIWKLRFIMDEEELEKVQHRATKLVPHIADLPYQQRLEYLRLPSLKYRRLRADLLQVYKIFSEQDRLNPDIFFQDHLYPATRGHDKKLMKPRAKTNLRSNSFSNRVIDHWNSLPQHVIDSTSINMFQTQLDNHLSDKRFCIYVHMQNNSKVGFSKTNGE